MDTGDESATACFIVCSLFMKNIMLRFVKDYALYVHLAYKDDDLFRNGMQLDIKEDTRRGNLKGKCVFNILILLLVFIIVKYDFILRYEARVNASSFIENVPQISAKPIAFQRNLLGKLPRNRPFFTNHFSAKLASKIPAKFPRNRPFFLRICP